MNWTTSKLVDSFAESKTLALGSKAKKMKAEGRPVINFAAGEPDFSTKPSIVEAAHQAAQAGQTKYTAVPGTAQAREAVARRLSEDYDSSFSAGEVCLSTGGKQAIFHFLQAVLEPGDEVLIPVPYWTSFPEMVKIVGAKPVLVRPEGERLTGEDLKRAITDKTRLLIYNSPSNPAGTVFSAEEQEGFWRAIEDKPIWVMSDDTYYALVYEPSEFVSVLKQRPDFKERTCIIGSSSKSYAMTGWRLGWAVGPEAVIKAMVKLQGQVTSGPNSMAQAGLVEALGPSHGCAEEFRSIFKKRRDLLVELLSKLPKLALREPQGAFYCFVKLSEAIGDKSVSEFCEQVLESHELCLVPGEAFGEPDYARMSYALSEDEIREGVGRLEKALGG